MKCSYKFSRAELHAIQQLAFFVTLTEERGCKADSPRSTSSQHSSLVLLGLRIPHLDAAAKQLCAVQSQCAVQRLRIPAASHREMLVSSPAYLSSCSSHKHSPGWPQQQSQVPKAAPVGQISN